MISVRLIFLLVYDFHRHHLSRLNLILLVQLKAKIYFYELFIEKTKNYAKKDKNFLNNKKKQLSSIRSIAGCRVSFEIF